MVKLEKAIGDAHKDAKMELVLRASELMPQGKPNYLQMRHYPAICTLVGQLGMATMSKIILVMLKDFCGSLNVVRNMSEDQMIEASIMLLDECGDFRLEDYVMMFTLAKRGQLLPDRGIMDRVDLDIIGKMLDAYWDRRNAAAEAEINKKPDLTIPAGAKMADPKEVSKALLSVVDNAKRLESEYCEADDELAEERRQLILTRQRLMYEGKTEELKALDEVTNKELRSQANPNTQPEP